MQGEKQKARDVRREGTRALIVLTCRREAREGGTERGKEGRKEGRTEGGREGKSTEDSFDIHGRKL